MVLPDASIWVAYLRAGAELLTDELNRALDRREVLVCGPVVAELVAGARPPDRAALVAALTGLPWAELDHNAWHSAGLLGAELRDLGQPLPLADLEIAVAAHAAGAALWTADRHFERVAAILEGFELRLLR